MPYNDSLGNLTIGYGHLVSDGVSNAAVDQITSDDIQSAIGAAQAQNWWSHVADNDARSNACIELLFILGPTKFAGFHDAIAALLADDFETAGNQFVNSLLEHEDGERIDRLGQMISTGQFPTST
jgi:GH24 family phage-related lysozyme (muramidase)